MKAGQLDTALLRRAIALYLETAYPSGGLPERTKPLAELEGLPEDARGEALLAWQGFERAPEGGASPEETRRFQIRLGNHLYPHMKLSLDRRGEEGEFVLEVDTHDRHLSPELMTERLKKAQAHNEELKLAIERDWAEAGLDTCRGRLVAFCEEEVERSGGHRPAKPPAECEHFALLVDDDPDILDVESLLVEAEGFCPLAAQSATEALSKVAACQGSVDLALIDIMMPGKSGYDVVEELRKKGSLHGPVLFLTAMMGSQVRTGLADAVMHKPFEVAQLRDTLREILAKKTARER